MCVFYATAKPLPLDESLLANLSGTLGSILGKSDDPQIAARTAGFYGELQKLLSNIMADSNVDAEKKSLARALAIKVRGGGFCGLTPGNSYFAEFGMLV